jgi:hypothetical protein
MNQFEFVECEMTRDMLRDGYSAVSRCELWDWLKTYEPEEGKGFMYSKPTPEMERINSEITTDHSGSTYGFVMRRMQYIAKHGYDGFKKAYLDANRSRIV